MADYQARTPIGLSRATRSPRAFTLIEVLVVVAIIAVLVAILLPSLARARAQTRSASCSSNLKQMGIAMTMFSSQHGGRVPRGISRHGGSGDPTGPVNWVRMISRMFGDKGNYAANFNRVPVERLPVFSCPQRSLEYGGVFLDYVVNSTDSRGPITLSPCAPNPTGGSWYEVEGVTKIDAWDLPAETIYVTEAVEESWNVSDSSNSWGTLQGIRKNIASVRQQVPPIATGLDWFDVPGAACMPTYKDWVSTAWRPRAASKMHLNLGSNAVFVDGHAEMVKPPIQRNTQIPVVQFYLRRFGVDRRVIPSITSTAQTVTASNTSPCVQGDANWRP